ncbi:MAG: tail fiber domain-containing protein [Lysobacterales bacterium]
MKIARIIALPWLALSALSGSGPAEAATDLNIERPEASASASVRIIGPDGQSIERNFAAGQAVRIDIRGGDGQVLADGLYRYEAVFAPRVDRPQQTAAQSVRATGDTRVPADWPSALQGQSGSFFILEGQLVDPALVESASGTAPAADSPNTSAAPPGLDDQVIPDDLIVQGSACVGFDCVNNEAFGFDTIRLKENNTRLSFQDTSTGTFPANDWELTANDNASGGANRFSILDVSNARVPFTVTAGAPSDSLFIDNIGRVGLRTSTPVLDLHVSTGNTPALRLDQTGASGFTPQIWDIAGNEANFFIRDVTAGSRLPFRIFPGAPTSSLAITGSGDLGLGLTVPTAALQLRRSAAFAGSWLLVDTPDDANAATEDRRLELDNQGNLFVSGSITQLSSRSAKENFQRITADQVLGRLAGLPIWSWNYLNSGSDDRHIGPVAEDFYQVFGFGRSERSLAPGDVAGVALAAAQALGQQLAERDREIDRLQARLARLEALLAPADDGGQAADGQRR